MPVAIEGDGQRRARRSSSAPRSTTICAAIGTGETYAIEAGLVVSCIGYQTPPIAGVPYEHGRGRFANDEGRILPGLYCVGWARRGPSGTIGTNKPDGARIAEHGRWTISAAARARRGAPGSTRCSPAAASTSSPSATGGGSRRPKSPPRSTATRARNSPASRRCSPRSGGEVKAARPHRSPLAAGARLCYAGYRHLATPAPFSRDHPAWVPRPALVVAATGVAEIAGAIGLTIPATRKAAGWGLALYALCVWPANFHHALRAYRHRRHDA